MKKSGESSWRFCFSVPQPLAVPAGRAAYKERSVPSIIDDRPAAGAQPARYSRARPHTTPCPPACAPQPVLHVLKKSPMASFAW